MKTFTEDNLKEAINKQMEINGYPERYEDLQKIEDWYIKFTTTKEKEAEYKEYLKGYFKKLLPKKMVEKEVNMFILNYGLKVTDLNYNK